MKKFTILNVLGKTQTTPTFGSNAKIQIENLSDVEQAIEKINLFPVNAIIIDKNNETTDIEKITKIGQLLHSQMRIFVFDFQNDNNYEKFAVSLWEEDFKQRMAKYKIEDNAMLN